MVPAARLIPAGAVWLAAAGAGAWYATLLLARDRGLMTPAYDQAFFQQVVWGLGHGRWFASSFTPGSFLALHFEPLLALPGAVELIVPDPRLLSVLAAASIASLGPAAYLFLRPLTKNAGLASALAAPLPLWPPLQEAARAGFHPEYMGAALALLAGAAALRGHHRLALGLAVLALTAREDQAWNVAVVALAVAGQPGLRRTGLLIFGIALAWGAIVIGLVMPVLREGNQLDTASYYAWLAGASPAALAGALAAPGGWLAFLAILACAGGLAILRPAWLALALPPLLADLLSAHDPQPLLHLQYALPVVIPVLVAAARAAPLVAGWRPAAVFAGPGLLAAILLGVLPPSPAAHPEPFQQPAALHRLLDCTARVPATAPVAADDTLLPPLASRAVVHELGAAQARDHLVIDRRARIPGYVDRAARDRVAAAGGRAVLCDDGRFLVLAPVGPWTGLAGARAGPQAGPTLSWTSWSAASRGRR